MKRLADATHRRRDARPWLAGLAAVALGLAGCAHEPPPASAAPPPAPPPPPPPKVMTLVTEKSMGSLVTAETEGLAIPMLLERKVPVVDPGMVQANLKRIQTILAQAGDEQGATEVGLQFGADVVLRGQAETKQVAASIAGSHLKSYQATVSLRAICTDDARLLATASETAGMIALDDVSGASKATRVAARAALDGLIPAMLAAWERKCAEGPAPRGGGGPGAEAALTAALTADTNAAAEAAIAPPPPEYRPPVTALWALTPQTGVSSNWMGPVTETLYAAVARSRWFRLVTRDDMARILAEHRLQMTEVCDSATRAVEFGKILNAEKMLIGSASRLGTTYQVVLKLINVESGEIERVGQAEARGNPDVLLRLARQAAADLLRPQEAPPGTPAGP